MPLPVSVQAQQDQVRLRQVQGKGAVGDHVDDEKPHPLGLRHQVPQRFPAVPPQKGLAAAEEQDADAHAIEPLHFRINLLVWMDDRRDIIDRAVLTVEIALVRENDRAQDRLLPAQQD